MADYYLADIRSLSDYYPFGMEMAARSWNADGYRYGFQGQETDDEVGSGNSVFFKYRVHDPRVGRFLSIDPLAADYPANGPYNFSENRVIDAIELEGLEIVFINQTILNPENSKRPISTLTDEEIIQFNHELLDVLGWAPGPLGMGADAINSKDHFYQGNYASGTASAVSVLLQCFDFPKLFKGPIRELDKIKYRHVPPKKTLSSTDIVEEVPKIPNNSFDEFILYRIVKKDKKGRTYGWDSPNIPTLLDFNPRIKTLKAEDLTDFIPKHTVNDVQLNNVKKLSNDDLIKLRTDDPISANGLNLTGGNHRVNEILKRVEEGTMSPDTPINILLHD